MRPGHLRRERRLAHRLDDAFDDGNPIDVAIGDDDPGRRHRLGGQIRREAQQPQRESVPDQERTRRHRITWICRC